MIESGTSAPGVDPAAFDMPPGTAVRIERPAPALDGYVTDYHVLDSDVALWGGKTEMWFPEDTNIRFLTTAGPVHVVMRNARTDVPRMALCGPMSRAIAGGANGGITIGAGITPLGWSRLFRSSAANVRDRYIPLDLLWPDEGVVAMHARLMACDPVRDAKPLLDDFLLERLSRTAPHPDEPVIRALTAIIDEGLVDSIEEAAARCGVGDVQLRRVAIRHFGFPPKFLLRRRRFFHAMMPLIAGDDAIDYGMVLGRYYDASHFLRDANLFLGTTPRRFLASNHAYLRAVLRARMAVLSAPQGDVPDFIHAAPAATLDASPPSP